MARPASTWVLGAEVRSAGVHRSALPTEPSPQVPEPTFREVAVSALTEVFFHPLKSGGEGKDLGPQK